MSWTNVANRRNCATNVRSKSTLTSEANRTGMPWRAVGTSTIAWRSTGLPVGEELAGGNYHRGDVGGTGLTGVGAGEGAGEGEGEARARARARARGAGRGRGGAGEGARARGLARRELDGTAACRGVQGRAGARRARRARQPRRALRARARLAARGSARLRAG